MYSNVINELPVIITVTFAPWCAATIWSGDVIYGRNGNTLSRGVVCDAEVCCVPLLHKLVQSAVNPGLE